VRVDWQRGADGQMKMAEVPGSEFELRSDLVLLAMGFLGPRRRACSRNSGSRDGAHQRQGEHR
jgi:glutamate synthase (NADPH/NADH) small chain